MMPDTSDLEQFIRAMWPEIPSGHWLLFWGTPSKRSEWVSSETNLADILTLLEQRATKENVYIGCASRGSNLGPTLRGDRADCLAIPGLWLDIDYGADHKKPNLPPTEDDALALLDSLGVPPSCVIHSGRGLQAWWWFKEPWIFGSEEERKQAEALTKGWSTTLLTRAKERGWAADAVGDLPRVMRLPGLWNRKGVAKPTRLLSLADLRYNPSEFESFLVAGAEKSADALPDVKWDIALSANAEPPADKFVLLAEIDTQFKLSWLHARKDLQDQSASSYDLALATRAFAASWTPQEVVNLLIAHRRKHNEDLKLRKDYYERTLSKALSGREQETRKQLVEDLKAGKSLPETISKDPAEVMSILSDRLGVALTKLVRYRSDTNTYQIEAAGRVINVPNIEFFDSQTRFRRMILDHTDHRIPVFKDEAWGNIVSSLFRAVEDVDVSMARKRDSFANFIEMYLTSSPHSVRDESGWMEACVNGSPFVLKGWVWIPTSGFLRFLNNQWRESITSGQLSFTLTQLGYEHEQKTIRTPRIPKTSRSCWKVREYVKP